MTTRNKLLVTALAGVYALVTASLFSAQTPPPAAAPPHSQAAAAPAPKPVARKASTSPVTHAKQSTVALTRIEILPSSISIMGPRYNQRLLVEGTFADGHQEELTPQASLAVSHPKVATVDIENSPLPQGDGQATITATVKGHRAMATVNVKAF